MVIEALLVTGADPNYADQAGFPSLVAALSSERPDRAQVLKLLLAAGAVPAISMIRRVLTAQVSCQ
jgi:hypothetical protein